MFGLAFTSGTQTGSRIRRREDIAIVVTCLMPCYSYFPSHPPSRAANATHMSPSTAHHRVTHYPWCRHVFSPSSGSAFNPHPAGIMGTISKGGGPTLY